MSKVNGNYKLSAYQKTSKGDWMKIDGKVEILSQNKFTVYGTLEVYNNTWFDKFVNSDYGRINDPNCVKNGLFTFRRSPNKKYLRLRASDYKECYKLLGDLDIFISN